MLVRGFEIKEFQVAEKYASVTSHRPLHVTLELSVHVLPPDIPLQTAYGAAYVRSDAKLTTLRQLLDGIAQCDDTNLLDVRPDQLQALYDQMSNCFDLCTKRTKRKQLGESWESNLEPEDVARLTSQRVKLMEAERKLTPTSLPAERTACRDMRSSFDHLVVELKQKAVERLAASERAEARQHAATWKLLASFGQKRVQPEVPPSAIYQHYKGISQATSAPLEAPEVPRLFTRPLTSHDAKLEDDVSVEEAKEAVMSINLQSAPGPDGLPPQLIQRVFSTTLLLSFLARLLTRCFRAKWVPAQWRTSENFILYKGVGDTTDVSSFRAISLTQILAKVPS